MFRRSSNDLNRKKQTQGFFTKIKKIVGAIRNKSRIREINLVRIW